jgi:hypothetical protein
MQGMNEIASAFLQAAADESEAFWWFHAFMEKFVCF